MFDQITHSVSRANFVCCSTLVKKPASCKANLVVEVEDTLLNTNA